jgi:hypothetical protein
VQVHQVHKLFPLISVQIGIVSRLFRISPKTGSDLLLRPLSGVPTGCRYVQVHFLDNESPMVALATGSLGTARRSISFCRTADAQTPSARALRYRAIAAKALRPTTCGVITAQRRSHLEVTLTSPEGPLPLRYCWAEKPA